MQVKLFCKDEGVSPWKSRMGQEHKPLTLTLDDRSDENPLKELVEMRIEEEEEKSKWTGKCKGKSLCIGVHRIGKFNGIARIEGVVVSVDGVAAPVTAVKK
jgi:hypothetical protein